MKKAKRYNYVIGDVQGCFEALKALLQHIEFDEQQDFIWFAGDLVARGENSLDALRYIKTLCEKGCAATVLGNHDLTFIACARGFKKVKEKDNMTALMQAQDRDVLVEWLRQQPLCLFPNEHTILTHAGVPCIWTAEQTAQFAKEVQQVIGHQDLSVLDAFLQEMYGVLPDIWDSQLCGHARIRTIINYLTRMRLTNQDGRLEFTFKDSLNEPMPNGFDAWFRFPSLATSTHQILFGHWAALQARQVMPKIQNIDGGCVWGNQLVAYCLEKEQCFKVNNPVTS